MEKKRKNPKRNALIACIVIGVGILLAIIGVFTAQDGKITPLLYIGGIMVLVGIIWNLMTMRSISRRRS